MYKLPGMSGTSRDKMGVLSFFPPYLNVTGKSRRFVQIIPGTFNIYAHTERKRTGHTALLAVAVKANRRVASLLGPVDFVGLILIACVCVRTPLLWVAYSERRTSVRA